jgi:hypothetical protein
MVTPLVSECCAAICLAFRWRCQLPAGHDGEHVHETDQERVTWTPRVQA